MPSWPLGQGAAKVPSSARTMPTALWNSLPYREANWSTLSSPPGIWSPQGTLSEACTSFHGQEPDE